MSNVVLLFLCLAAGVALRASGRVPDNAHLAINGFIINISLPALTLLQIHGIELHSELYLPHPDAVADVRRVLPHPSG